MTEPIIVADHPDEFDYYCNGECDRCDDDWCSEHPSERWKYDVGYAEDMFCPTAGIGCYHYSETCEFVCPLSKWCEEVTEESGLYDDVFWEEEEGLANA